MHDGSGGAASGELIRTTSEIIWGSTDQKVPTVLPYDRHVGVEASGD